MVQVVFTKILDAAVQLPLENQETPISYIGWTFTMKPNIFDCDTV